MVKKRIIVDTNVLLAISQFKLDIFAAIEENMHFSKQIFILEGTLTELQKIANPSLYPSTNKAETKIYGKSKSVKKIKGSDKFAANLALQIIISYQEKGILKLLPSFAFVDDELVKQARTPNTIIFTQDKDLQRRLKQIKAPFISIRQKKQLVLSN